MAAFVKCKLGRALGHQELLEQGLDHFSHGVRATDVKCVHTAAAAATTGRESPGAGRGRGGFAELHLHVNEASVNPVRLLEREEREVTLNGWLGRMGEREHPRPMGRPTALPQSALREGRPQCGINARSTSG